MVVAVELLLAGTTAATAFPKTPTIADLQVVFPALLVTRDDRERMATLLRLYEYAERLGRLGALAGAVRKARPGVEL